MIYSSHVYLVYYVLYILTIATKEKFIRPKANYFFTLLWYQSIKDPQHKPIHLYQYLNKHIKHKHILLTFIHQSSQHCHYQTQP